MEMILERDKEDLATSTTVGKKKKGEKRKTKNEKRKTKNVSLATIEWEEARGSGGASLFGS
ncbi:hypothetical protein [Bacillus toyonensis]|uniref:hypothetical protein n=1 Tax=Bacillus toyonensis TaxID=155322 RepID=UPI0011A466E9|nr:hypothetical protein [Bacillus toyonensis]